MSERRLVDEMPPMFPEEEEIARKRANAHLAAGVSSGFTVVKIIDHFRPRILSTFSARINFFSMGLIFGMMVFPSSAWYKDIVNQLPNGYFREVHVNGLAWTKEERVNYFEANPKGSFLSKRPLSLLFRKRNERKIDRYLSASLHSSSRFRFSIG